MQDTNRLNLILLPNKPQQQSKQEFGECIKKIVCGLCLSFGRQSVTNPKLIQQVISYLPKFPVIYPDDNVCWECQARLRNALLFHKQARYAQAVIANVIVQHRGTSVLIQSLSTLQKCNQIERIDIKPDVSMTSVEEETNTEIDIDESSVTATIEPLLCKRVDDNEDENTRQADSVNIETLMDSDQVTKQLASTSTSVGSLILNSKNRDKDDQTQADPKNNAMDSDQVTRQLASTSTSVGPTIRKRENNDVSMTTFKEETNTEIDIHEFSVMATTERVLFECEDDDEDVNTRRANSVNNETPMDSDQVSRQLASTSTSVGSFILNSENIDENYQTQPYPINNETPIDSDQVTKQLASTSTPVGLSILKCENNDVSMITVKEETDTEIDIDEHLLFKCEDDENVNTRRANSVNNETPMDSDQISRQLASTSTSVGSLIINSENIDENHQTQAYLKNNETPIDSDQVTKQLASTSIPVGLSILKRENNDVSMTTVKEETDTEIDIDESLVTATIEHLLFKCEDDDEDVNTRRTDSVNNETPMDSDQISRQLASTSTSVGSLIINSENIDENHQTQAYPKNNETPIDSDQVTKQLASTSTPVGLSILKRENNDVSMTTVKEETDTEIDIDESLVTATIEHLLFKREDDDEDVNTRRTDSVNNETPMDSDQISRQLTSTSTSVGSFILNSEDIDENYQTQAYPKHNETPIDSDQLTKQLASTSTSVGLSILNRENNDVSMTTVKEETDTEIDIDETSVMALIEPLLFKCGGDDEDKNTRQADPVNNERRGMKSSKIDLSPNKTRRRRGLTCQFCGKTFKFHSSLPRHIRGIHEKRRYECAVCKKTYSCAASMTSHVRMKHMELESNNDTYYCKECDKFYPTQNCFKKHLKNSSIHAVNRFECDYCGKVTHNKPLLVSHIEGVHLRLKQESCTLCEKYYYTKMSLRQHEKLKHGTGMQRKHMCSECGKVFFTTRSLACHQRTHSGTRPFACPHCDYRAVQSTGVLKHCKSKHKDKPQLKYGDLHRKRTPLKNDSFVYLYCSAYPAGKEPSQ